MLLCWKVIVTGRDTGGRIHAWGSKPMSLTDAWFQVAEYERMKHKARIECLEPMVELNKRVNRGELDLDEAKDRARELGYSS